MRRPRPRPQPPAPPIPVEESFTRLPEPLRGAARSRRAAYQEYDAAYTRFEESPLGAPNRPALRRAFLETQEAYDAAVDQERGIRRAMGRDDPFGNHPERDDPHWRRNRRRKA